MIKRSSTAVGTEVPPRKSTPGRNSGGHRDRTADSRTPLGLSSGVAAPGPDEEGAACLSTDDSVPHKYNTAVVILVRLPF